MRSLRLATTLLALTVFPAVLAAQETGCTSGDETLCLREGRFRAELSWNDPRSGKSGVGHAVGMTRDSGYFWFFNQKNVEVVLKILDGRTLTGHFWVFYASMSDVAYSLTVTDTVKGESRTYENPAFTMASRADTSAFAEAPPAPGDPPADPEDPPADPEDPPTEPPGDGSEPPPEDFETAYARILQEAETMTPAQFHSRYAPPEAVEKLSYDPLSAELMDAIRRGIGLDEEQEALLAANGFVVLNDFRGLDFVLEYQRLFLQDLPVLVTTDSILYALHRSYDSLLKNLELVVLVAEVDSMLAKMHGELSRAVVAGDLDSTRTAVRDADVYLTVARNFLSTEPVAPVFSGNWGTVNQILSDARSYQVRSLRLFDQENPHYDYSQLKPRGHYEGDPVLERYFKALMWLGRTELRLVEQEKPERTALEGAFVLNALLEASGARTHWERFNLVIERMVGEKDSMDPPELDLFRQDSGFLTLADLDAASDEEILAALSAGSYGIQRIQSQILFSGPMGERVVLPRVYLLTGQRFVIDSYIFHNLTFDRIVTEPPRLLPTPLDVAFALGSDTASELLADEVTLYGYQGALHENRFLIDSHPADFWDANLYNGWLNAVRALNDSSDRERLPEAMRTRAWDRKLVMTELASWAELRHDTILYAKQSYSTGPGCGYPDAYVEPYPLFYERMAHLGRLGLEMSATLEADGLDMSRAKGFFQSMADVLDVLGGIARKELAHEPLTDTESELLRMTIEMEGGDCGPIIWDGWYASLFFDRTDMGVPYPTIADVHTEPGGRVLHTATGYARPAVFTLADEDGKVYAYVGPVSSFHTVIGTGFTRYTDSEWERLLPVQGEESRPSWDRSFAH